MAFYLFNCKQLDEVCNNHTLSKHTSIITSQMRFAYDNFTYMFNINVHLDYNGMIFKEGMQDALDLIVGNYPELCNLLTSDMLSRRSMGPNLVLNSRISQVILHRTIKHLLNSFHNTDTGNRLERTYLDTLLIAVVAPSARIYLWYS